MSNKKEYIIKESHKDNTPVWCDEHHEKVGKGGRAIKRSDFKKMK